MNYDLGYFENMLRLYSATARGICDVRWQWVADILQPGMHVLDYGSGVGWFRAWRPEGIEVDSYDINPASPQTGISPMPYDLLCLWDVLEHIPDMTRLRPLLDQVRYVAATIPIKPADVPWRQWSHWKVGEHLHYWSLDIVEALFEHFGFRLLKHGQPECPPRRDIVSFLFEKADNA